MEKNFDTVDFKIAESEFFIRKMSEVRFDLLEFRFFFSAFIASARSVTLALQQFGHLDGFETWYAPHQALLRKNLRARYFLETRNAHLHGGSYPISGASHQDGKSTYHFRDPAFGKLKLGNDDVVDQCRRFFLDLLTIVYDCYQQLGPSIDPHQFYTQEHFRKTGRSLQSAELEVFGWTHERIEGERASVAQRWQHLRSQLNGCRINHLFKAYLDMVTPQPKLPAGWEDFEFSDEDRGWNHIPAGFASVEDWRVHMKEVT
jgi:hypothetical protein